MTEPDRHAEREESSYARRDRHWSELLQELRVVQTGVQLLAGFLLTIPFQARFDRLSADQKNLYLVATVLATLSAGLLIAPVSLHRMLFRRDRRAETVMWSDRLAKLGLFTLALTMATVVALIFSVVVSTAAAIGVVVTAVAFFVMVWLVLPLTIARGARRRPESE